MEPTDLLPLPKEGMLQIFMTIQIPSPSARCEINIGFNDKNANHCTTEDVRNVYFLSLRKEPNTVSHKRCFLHEFINVLSYMNVL
jgi:hypothetical protein